MSRQTYWVLSLLLLAGLIAGAGGERRQVSAQTLGDAKSVARADTSGLTGKQSLEEKRLTLEVRKEEIGWRKFLFDFWYRVCLTALVVVLIIGAFPAVTELAVTLPGGGGVNLKRAEKLPPVHPPTVELAEVSVEAVESLRSTLGPGPTEKVLTEVERLRSYATAGIPPDGIYLCHKIIGRPQGAYRRVRIYIDADDPQYLARVQRVIYHLHPTFPNPTMEVTNPANGFELQISAWGEFMMSADAVLAGPSRSIVLKRYINF